MLITFGRLLSGSPATIELNDIEAVEFHRLNSYQAKLYILRGAALRVHMVDMLLSDGRICPNIAARRPEPGEEVVWLRGQAFCGLDEQQGPITLSPETAEQFSAPRGGRPNAATPQRRIRKTGPSRAHDGR